VNEAPARPERGSSGATTLGVVLIVIGLVFFIGQQFGMDLTDVGWPAFIILPGLALLTLGLTQARGSGLAIAGSIVTIVGLVFFYQRLYDHYESWAYAWALVGPGGSGLGQLLYGTRSGDRKMARDGFWSIVTGLGLFAVGFIFFEGVIGLSGEPWPFPAWVMPVAIIVIGLLLLLRGFTANRSWQVAEKPVVADATASAEASAQSSEQPSEGDAPSDRPNA